MFYSMISMLFSLFVIGCGGSSTAVPSGGTNSTISTVPTDLGFDKPGSL